MNYLPQDQTIRNRLMIKVKEIQKRTKVSAEARLGVEKYIFRLFVAGMLPNSACAIENIKAICMKYLVGRYKLNIIDLFKQPSLASIENIIALPMLIKECPLPEKRLIGDMSNTEMVLKGLNLLIPS